MECSYACYMTLHKILHGFYMLFTQKFHAGCNIDVILHVTTYPPISESGGVRHYMLNYELYMLYTCILHPACKIGCKKLANLCSFDCNLIQLHVILHYIPHYMKKCITWKLHDNYMIYYMYYKHFTSVSFFSHLKKCIRWKLRYNYTIYYMYYRHFTSVSFFQLKMTFFCNLRAANLFNVHADVRTRPCQEVPRASWDLHCQLDSHVTC